MTVKRVPQSPSSQKEISHIAIRKHKYVRIPKIKVLAKYFALHVLLRFVHVTKLIKEFSLCSYSLRVS
jgi:hypothetical protein